MKSTTTQITVLRLFPIIFLLAVLPVAATAQGTPDTSGYNATDTTF